ncbi:MAG: D-Ala-D-Ala carboxypeptidase family metallohydrolase [Rhizobiaceae bacterium]
MLLASCASTTDGDTLFGFNPAASGPASSTDFSRPTVNSAASAAPVFDFDEDDPLLPDSMTDLPPTRERAVADTSNVAESQEAASQAQETAQSPQPAEEQLAAATDEQPAADAPDEMAQADQPVDAQSASGSGSSQQRGFLSAFFSPQPSSASERAASATSRPAPQAESRPQTESRPQIAVAPANPGAGAATRPATMSGEALPGVRQGSLFDIGQRSSIDDDGRSNPPGSYRVASAAGLARLAPNGLRTQTERVDVNCLQPALVRKLRHIENHFGRPVIVTSGYRSPPANRRARGASNSLHMYCAAADIQIEGVSKAQLADYVRKMPGRGGVGTYCHTESVHVDIGPERDWNWRCRRRN